jgi:hypothetical protein
MGIGSKFRQAMRSFEDESRRMAKYTLAAGGAMMGGSSGAAAGYQIGSSLDDRKPNNKSGTDLGKLRSEAIANGFNPLTVLRATGGQGFYHNQIPMGRLSSDAFFNAFDAYDNYQNKNTNGINTIRTSISSNEILGSTNLDNNGKLNSNQNLGKYEFIQDPVTREGVHAEGFGTTSAKNKAMWGTFETRHGKRVTFPFTEFEADQMLTQGAFNLFMEATHFRDQALSKVSDWWNGAKKDKTPMNEIREKVNSQTINKSYLHTPKLSSNWSGYKYTKALD